MTTSHALPHPVLADRLAGSWVRDAALVVGAALLTALAAQVEVPLWFTPVPISGQTFAVLVAGAALGLRRGAASQLLYVALGAVGMPFYAGGDAGWTHLTGATGGYLVGFVLAAAVVGALAERGLDRTPLRTLAAMTVGTAVIFACGVPWLAVALGVGAGRAVALGLTPFLLGAAVKIALAMAVLPAAWRLSRR